MRRLAQGLMIGLIIFILTLFVLELLLRFADPWKVLAGLRNNASLTYVLDAVRGYYLQPGDYHLIGWGATVQADTTRLVPHTNTHASCKIILLGDSVTFGQGVNDDETWADLLARQFPDVWFINTGVIGYGIDNITMALAQFPGGNGYLYTLVDNDNEKVQTDAPKVNTDILRSALLTYLYVISYQAPPAMPDSDFFAKLDSILATPNLQIVAFETGGLSQRVAAHNATVRQIPMWKNRISPFDGHANALGNQEIASGMRPIAESLIKRVCPVSP